MNKHDLELKRAARAFIKFSKTKDALKVRDIISSKGRGQWRELIISCEETIQRLSSTDNDPHPQKSSKSPPK